MTCMISFIITKAFVAPEIKSTNRSTAHFMSCALGRYITELHKLIPRSDLNWIRRRSCWTNTDSDLKLKPQYSSWQKTTTLRVSTTRPQGSNPFTNKQSWSFIYRNILKFICIRLLMLVHLIGILLVIAVRSPNNFRSLNFTSVITESL